MYAYNITTTLPYDDAIDKLETALKKQGFGIVTKMDVQEKFKDKLGIDYGRYVILGACSPKDAHRALETEKDIGVLLPCNLAVY